MQAFFENGSKAGIQPKHADRLSVMLGVLDSAASPEDMMCMHNPPHPGKAVREFLGEMTVTEAASRLGVTRVSLSRIINGTNGISADMALRLAAAFGTSAEMWLNMQTKYDLWQAENKPRPEVLPFREPAHA